MSEELKPCPFCSGKAIVWVERSEGMLDSWQAGCNFKINPRCMVQPETDCMRDKDSAIAAWNKRDEKTD